MENLNFLRENQANLCDNGRLFLKGKRNLLKEFNDTGKVINQISNKVNSNIPKKSDMKMPNAISKDVESEFLESDVSMLSINDNSQSCRYFLPHSKDFANESVVRKFAEDVLNRRNLNRNLTSDKLRKYRSQIMSISFDVEIGGIFVLEILDNMVDLECSQQLLGLDFLENTNVTVIERNVVVNNLYTYCNALAVCRHSVPSAMAIFDRFIKTQGKSFHCENLNLLSVTCWFMACKNDLMRYPYIEDICNIACIKEADLITNYEIKVLKGVNFYLSIPTAPMFLRPLSVIKSRRGVSHSIGKLMTEICTAAYELAGHPAHILGAASYCISMSLSYRMLRFDEFWTPIIQFITGIDIDDIRPVIIALAKILHSGFIEKQFPAITEEYSAVFSVLKYRIEDLKLIITGKEEI